MWGEGWLVCSVGGGGWLVCSVWDVVYEKVRD